MLHIYIYDISRLRVNESPNKAVHVKSKQFGKNVLRKLEDLTETEESNV